MPRYTPKPARGPWPHLVGLGVFLFPLALARVDFRSAFPQGLTIRPVRTSPAYAAFEDSFETYADGDEWDKMAEPTRVLASGTPASVRPGAVGLRRVDLAGLTVRAPARPEHLERPERIVAGVRIIPPGGANRDIFDAPAAKSLSPVARRALALSRKALRSHPLARDREFAVTPPLSVVAPGSPLTPRSEGALVPDRRLSQISPTGNPSRDTSLEGQLEMTGGLAFVGPETHLEVKHVVDGRPIETGRINVSEGRFQIRVRKNEGLLVAELREPDGRLLGRGQLDLARAGSAPAADRGRGADRGGPLKIALRPASEAPALRVVASAARGRDRVPTRAGRGTVTGTAALGEGVPLGEGTPLGENEIGSPPARGDFFSDHLVQSLIESGLLGSDPRGIDPGAVTWGQVKNGDDPVAGARVEVDATSGTETHVVYFNESYLPDPSLTATSANGLYAVIKVPGT